MKKLRMLPFNTSLQREDLLAVASALESQYSAKYAGFEILPATTVAIKDSPNLFYHKTDLYENDSPSVDVSSNGERDNCPSPIFHYLREFGDHTLAITDLTLYNPNFHMDIYKMANGIVSLLGTGIITTKKFIGERDLSITDRTQALLVNHDPNLRRRLKRLFCNGNNLFLDKLKFLAVHEVGHLNDLEHCFNTIEETGKNCAMVDSHFLSMQTGRCGWTMPHDYDLQGYRLCGECKVKLEAGAENEKSTNRG